MAGQKTFGGSKNFWWVDKTFGGSKKLQRSVMAEKGKLVDLRRIRRDPTKQSSVFLFSFDGFDRAIDCISFFLLMDLNEQ